MLPPEGWLPHAVAVAGGWVVAAWTWRSSQMMSRRAFLLSGTVWTALVIAALALRAVTVADPPRERILREQLRARPDSVALRLELVQYTLDELRRPVLAETLLARGLAHDPDQPRLLMRRSALRLRERRWPDALRDTERLLAVDSTLPGAWYNRGLALWGLERHGDAEAALRRSLELGGPVDAHLMLGRIAEARGDTAEALRRYRLRWALRDMDRPDRSARFARERVQALRP